MKNAKMLEDILLRIKSRKGANHVTSCTNCGQLFKAIPGRAIPWKEDGKLIGWLWNCPCINTTIFKIVIGE